MDQVVNLLILVSDLCLGNQGQDLKTAHSMLQLLLDLLHTILRYVSDVVRKALQVTKLKLLVSV